VAALHEPWPWLIEWAYRRAVKGEFAGDDMVKVFRNVVPIPPGPQVVGIVDQKLTPFITTLAAAVPQARFIWLIRDGRDVAASGYNRGWYGPAEGRPQTPYSRYRLRGDEVGAVSERAWQKMSAYERNAWYWAWCNEQIATALGGLPEERWMLARLEHLDLGAMQGFLGVEPVGLEMVHVNSTSALTRMNQGPPTEKPDREKKRAFKRQAGRMMDRLYPGWKRG